MNINAPENSAPSEKFRFETVKTDDDKRVGIWRDDLKKTSMTLEEIVHWQTDKNTGNPVKPGIKKDENGPSNAANVGEHDLLFLDIDGDEILTWESAIQDPFLQDNAAFFYATKNHQKAKTTKTGRMPACDRFRIILALPQTISQPEIIEFLNIAFVYLFGHDESCIEPSKIYLGNRGAATHRYNLKNRLNLRALFQLLLKNAGAMDKSVNRFVSNHSNQQFDFDNFLSFFQLNSEEKTAAKLCIDGYESVVRQFGRKREIEVNAKDERRKYRNFNFEYLQKNCKLLAPENITDSDHGELSLITSALTNISGGKQYYNSIINEETRPYDIKKRGKDYYPKQYGQILKKQYLPFSCNNYCRFSSTCEFPKRNPRSNLLHVQETKQHQVRAIKNYYASNSFKTTEEIRDELKRLISSISKKDDRNIHVLKVPCGIGKTFELQNLSKTESSFAIATPRLELFEGFAGFTYSKLPEELEELIKPYRNLGINWRRIIAAKEKDNNLSEQQKELWADYWQREEMWYLSHKKIFTHEKAFRDPERNFYHQKVIFFDEDPSWKMYPEKTVNRQFIAEILRRKPEYTNGKTASEIFDFLEDLLNTKKDTFINRPTFKKDSLKFFEAFLCHNVRTLNGSENIMDFLMGEKFYAKEYEISSMQIRRFPENKTIVILSATPNEIILRQTYGDRIIFHDLGKVRPRSGSKLIQFNGKSFSSSSLMSGNTARKNLEAVKAIRRKHQDFAFITHKGLKKIDDLDVLIGPDDLWFGAIEGLNSNGSKNLLIVGTKNMPPSYLKLLCACLNLDHESVSDYDPKSSKTIVTNEYFEFTIMALSPDPTIQKLQMHFTEEILLQAVGRARYYGNDVTVFLYSNYPLPEFEQFGHDPDLHEDDDTVENEED